MAPVGVLAVSPKDYAVKLLTTSYTFDALAVTESNDEPTSVLTLPDSSEIRGSNTITQFLWKQLPSSTFPELSDFEVAVVHQWLTLTNSSLPTSLARLNAHLSTRSTIVDNKPSIVDVAAYARIAPLAKTWSPAERTGEATAEGGEKVLGGWRYILRWLDYVQNAPEYPLKIEEKVDIDLDDIQTTIKAEEPKKEDKKKAAAAVAVTEDKEKPGKKGKSKVAATVEKVESKAQEIKENVKAAVVSGEGQGKKKEKKEKQARPQPEKKEDPPLSPALIDLRVGFIEKCIPHPQADSLYVSTIHVGEDEPRTVCSGLRGLIPLEEMQKRKVVVVCNLKPVKMRGIMSAAMVLAASPRAPPGADPHADKTVELVEVPADAEAGERVSFKGWPGLPEAQLNPKKKVWESMQPGFTTTEDLKVAFDSKAEGVGGNLAKSTEEEESIGILTTTSGGVCTVKSLKGATVR